MNKKDNSDNKFTNVRYPIANVHITLLVSTCLHCKTFAIQSLSTNVSKYCNIQ